MRSKRIFVNSGEFPAEIRPLLQSGEVYDESSSSRFRVLRLCYGDGFYLKEGPAGSLQKEARMTELFAAADLAAEVELYLPGKVGTSGKDYLLTAALPGESAVQEVYLEDPQRLAAVLGESLRELHEMDPEAVLGPACEDGAARYRDAVFSNHLAGRFDRSMLDGPFHFQNREEAWDAVSEGMWELRGEVLGHGDYCLPNIVLQDYALSGYVDLDCAGRLDRHIDLFWGLWSLGFNLGSYECSDTFLSAYGKDRVIPEKLRLIQACEVFS